jgi:hypothetical protein
MPIVVVSAGKTSAAEISQVMEEVVVFDREELARCPESLREGFGLALMCESLRQRLQRQLAQAEEDQS